MRTKPKSSSKSSTKKLKQKKKENKQNLESKPEQVVIANAEIIQKKEDTTKKQHVDSLEGKIESKTDKDKPNKIVLRDIHIPTLKDSPKKIEISFDDDVKNFTEERKSKGDIFLKPLALKGPEDSIEKLPTDLKKENPSVERRFDVESTFAGLNDSLNLGETKKRFKAPPLNPLQRILKLLNSDILWESVAAIMVLITFLFYFVGLQPRALNLYYESAINQADELSSTFTNQSTNVLNFTKFISSKALYNPLSTCTENELYTDFEEDRENARRLEVGTFPSVTLENLEVQGIFYDKEIASHYKQLYNRYTERLEMVEQELQQTTEFILFLNYRNHWLSLCKAIETNQRTATQAACSTFIEDINKLRENQEEQTLITSLEKSKSKSIDLCNQLISSKITFLNFQVDWLREFNNILNITLEFDELEGIVEVSTSDFKEKDTLLIKNKMHDRFKERTSFLGRFSLLDIKL